MCFPASAAAIACLAWVLRDTHPVAGFTTGHGENQADLLAFYTTLVAAGYDVTMMTLDEDIDEGVGLVVVANPRWDLERGAGVVSELDRLAAFLDDNLLDTSALSSRGIGISVLLNLVKQLVKLPNAGRANGQ